LSLFIKNGKDHCCPFIIKKATYAKDILNNSFSSNSLLITDIKILDLDVKKGSNEILIIVDNYLSTTISITLSKEDRFIPFSNFKTIVLAKKKIP